MEHGTEEMYRRELRQHRAGKGLEPCALCREAHAQTVFAYRDGKPPRDRSAETAKATARRRALNRLAERYPGTFKALLDEENRRLEL